MRFLISLFSVPVLCSWGFSARPSRRPGAHPLIRVGGESTTCRRVHGCGRRRGRSRVRRIGWRLQSSTSETVEVRDPADESRLTVTPLSTWFAAVGGQAEQRQQFFWSWRGHEIFLDSFASQENLDKPTVILAHGFAASTVYWRETIKALSEDGYNVFALDLLGQGRSSKPYSNDGGGPLLSDTGTGSLRPALPSEVGKNTETNVEYSISLYGEMVDDFARQFKLEEVVLMGNSIGSLVCLSAATGDCCIDPYLSSRVRGLCLFNCGIGLNSMNVLKNPDFSRFQVALFSGLFGALNALIFGNRTLLRYLLNVVTEDLLRDALRSLYPRNPDRVDEQLVESFYRPAKTGGDGGVDVVAQIYTNEAGYTPMEYHDRYKDLLDSLPLHLIWGTADVVTPLTGDVGVFYCDRVANNRSGKQTTSIELVDAGHLLFDEKPEEVHASMFKWLNRKVVT
ncbi:hypothetical protein THAOC_33338 [Thalassiosira oceanica]|uniref:AB hydrolase-1 domain-containing protein n=1 Tax=Thalassiosira oceanica TaxID=159749 RepID=K0RFZ9_THAOC|nr:hypothetical protein THAOC_33338 [Thalassiosira oceanica]|mmetsp:Transcript_12602/g.29766  ORF Transcript_12602/g.29766 Transcript_12602/m.29766 type:complete len:453 (-) Transcript_12602:998-2356(-)|eukprot:EJK47906.1 hypothetical protein THAOC_33338 [Thalassiosira oceanica]